MRRFIAALLAAALSFGASAEVWQARYGVAETFDFKLYNADGTLDVDEADGGTEVSVSCNEGAETTATNDFVDEGTFYSIALTASEMQCERVTVVVAATTTEVFFIQTSANASAMTPSYEANVGSVTDGTFVAADFAADAFTAAKFAADVTTEFQAGLATSSALTTVGNNVAAILVDTAEIGAAGAGLTNIDLPNQTMDITGTITTATSVTNTVTANMTQVSGDSAAADELELALDLRGGANGAIPWLGIHASGTAQAYTAGTPSITLAGTTAFGDNDLNCTSIAVRGATTDDWVTGTIQDYDGTGDVATLAAAFPNAPTGTLSYVVWGVACASGGGGGGDATAANQTTMMADLDNIQTRLPAALVSGRMDSSTGAMASNVLTAAATAADYLAEIQAEADDALVANHLDHLLAVDYDPAAKPGVATALLNELVQSDLGVPQFTSNALETAPSGSSITDWTADQRTAISAILGIPPSGTTPDDPTTGILDTTRDNVAAVKSDTVEILTDTSVIGTPVTTIAGDIATLLSRIGTPAGASLSADVAALKSVADAVKVKTDQLMFGVTNTLNVNVEYQNAAQMCGNGTSADKWRACP